MLTCWRSLRNLTDTLPSPQNDSVRTEAQHGTVVIETFRALPVPLTHPYETVRQCTDARFRSGRRHHISAIDEKSARIWISGHV